MMDLGYYICLSHMKISVTFNCVFRWVAFVCDFCGVGVCVFCLAFDFPYVEIVA